MNDHDLSASLQVIHRDRAVRRTPRLHERVRDIDFDDIPQQHGWLPRLPRWRFPSMFSAMKFVAGGAVVALFGGLLMTGVLPMGTDESQAPAATMSELVPGTDLEVEEVRAGVFRVLSDGVRPLSKNVSDVAVTPEGDIWVTKARHGNDGSLIDGRAIRLGDPKASLQHVQSVNVDLDGHLVAIGDKRRTWRREGTEWTELDEGSFQQPGDYPACLRGLSGLPVFRAGLAADGSCWSFGYYTEPIRWHDDRIDHLDPSTAGLDLEGQFAGVAVDQTGTVWTTLWADESESPSGFDGLVSFDGETWASIPYDGQAAPWTHGFRVIDIAPGEDGVVRVTLAEDEDPSGHYVVAWDGRSWAEYGPAGSRTAGWSGTHDLPDGRILFDGTAVLDGEELSLFDPLGLGPDTRYGPIEVMPDGTILTIVPNDTERLGGLYVIAPEAVTAAD